MLTSILDTREHDLRNKLQWPTKALPVGDVWIGISGESLIAGGVVAERKSAADLESSILDGRYREQRTRLLSYCQTNGYRPLYIIEGDLDRINGRLQESALLKHLTRLTLRYGVSVLQTNSTAETAKLCQLLQDQIQADAKVFSSEEAAKVQYTDTISVVKRGNREDPAVFASAVLQQCPGISAAGASAILEKFQTLTAIWNASVQDLSQVQVGKRKLGAVAAERLWKLFHQTT